MSALPRRLIAPILALFVASLVFSGPAVAAGGDVLADYDDNGTIDRCYTDAEFDEALRLIRARPDLQQYAAASTLIDEKRAECTEQTIGPADPSAAEDDDDGGPSVLLFIAGVVGAAAIAAGVVVAVRRRRGTSAPEA